ncbi:unnamed protein product [Hermetia illucens]|uniref:DDE-1 domain-containing protein n=1 Tax=Hermetia illucens TaxID=343691 RepID=A0A7R8UZX0_HERIL|nr:unnamed protein product [Hermetia illucens]
MYLPKNTIALIQSIDQHAFKTLKAHYKKRLLMGIVSQPNDHTSSLLRNFTGKDAFAWKQVKLTTLIMNLGNWEFLAVLDAALEIFNDVKMASESIVCDSGFLMMSVLI